MHVVLIILLLLLPPRAETPILNVLIQASAPVVRFGESLTYTIDVFSTANAVEQVHIEVIPDPRVKILNTTVWTDGTLGFAQCVPTLLRISCDAPIKSWSPVTVVVDVLLPQSGAVLWLCPSQTDIAATATLPDRIGTRARAVLVDAGTHCLDLPLILAGDP